MNDCTIQFCFIISNNIVSLQHLIDFVAMKHGVVDKLVQVCYELTPDYLKRELNGLLQAMRFFKTQKATLVTFNNTDFIKVDNFEIEVVPAYKYLLM